MTGCSERWSGALLISMMASTSARDRRQWGTSSAWRPHPPATRRGRNLRHLLTSSVDPALRAAARTLNALPLGTHTEEEDEMLALTYRGPNRIRVEKKA